MKPQRQTTRQPNLMRRRFLRQVAAGAIGGASVPFVHAGQRGFDRDSRDSLPPHERLHIAGVGLGVRGLGNIQKCEGANIVALCDVDWNQAATAFEAYPQAARYRDFRVMLEKQKDIDAVVVSTPDHTHAVVAAAAMRRGKHVFVETPLAHDIAEVRQLAELARETGVTTQMGIERHSGSGIRRAVEMVWGGGLGPIRQVHCWTNRPQWPQGIARPPQPALPRKGLDWDLWLGPAPERPFHAAYHPYRWRGWLDFGTGALGAMGCQLLDVVFWGLGLEKATTWSIAAESTGVHGETYPAASTIRYQFPARDDLPPVEVIWYDGGRRPPDPPGLPYHRELGSNGALFMGEHHNMLFGPTVFGTNPGQVGPRTIPEFTPIQDTRPYQKIPRVKETDWAKGNRHIQEWITHCKQGTQPCASFGYAAPLTEMALLGNVALRHAPPLQWDRQEARFTNVPEANQWIGRAYRPGWSL